MQKNNPTKTASAELKFVDEIKNLNKTLIKDGELTPKITRRIGSGWSTIGKLKNIFSNKLTV